jgi:hypothetical protein
MPFLLLGMPLVSLLFAFAILMQGVEEFSECVKKEKANHKANSKSTN